MRVLIASALVVTAAGFSACTPDEDDDRRRPGREGEGEGEGEGCTALTLSSPQGVDAEERAAVCTADISPGFGGASTDVADLGFFVTQGTIAPGVVDLGAGIESNYATCERCIRIFQDIDAPEVTIFFQRSGTLDVRGDALTALDVTLTNVKLVEVTIDAQDAVSTPVEGGACVLIPTATLSAPAASPIP